MVLEIKVVYLHARLAISPTAKEFVSRVQVRVQRAYLLDSMDVPGQMTYFAQL
jgi:hypothetical protein